METINSITFLGLSSSVLKSNWYAIMFYFGRGRNKMFFKFTQKNFICLQNAFERVNVLCILHKAPITALSTLLIKMSTTHTIIIALEKGVPT